MIDESALSAPPDLPTWMFGLSFVLAVVALGLLASAFVAMTPADEVYYPSGTTARPPRRAGQAAICVAAAVAAAAGLVWSVTSFRSDVDARARALDAQESEVQRLEKLIVDSVTTRYRVDEVSIDFSAEQARHALSETHFDAPRITVVTERDVQAAFTVEFDNDTGRATLIARPGDITPSELQRRSS